MALTLRIRTKDGTERLQATASTTLDALRLQIEQQFSIPCAQQRLSRSEQKGPVPTKGAAIGAAEAKKPLSALGLANGALLFLDYEMERENQAQSQAYANDPFRNLVQEGELRKQGVTSWTLTDFLDYRSTKEFKLEATPEPHCKFVQVDPQASQTLINFMLMSGFGCKRLGYLYGRWVTDEAEGAPGVAVHAIYEPKQDSTAEEIVLQDDAEGDAKLAQVAAMLGLVRVGVVIAHPAREYAFSVNEVLLAGKLHGAALEADPEKGRYFVTMKARPVLPDEEKIEGVCTIEAYQMTDQAIALCARDPVPFAQSKSDPRVAKTDKDCCFVVDKKEQRKATMEPFVARVFDIARPFQSHLGASFAVENRPTAPQTAERMADYLRARRGDPFLKTVSDLHFLVFLCNLLDINADMPVLCAKVNEQNGQDLDGFQMMINCYVRRRRPPSAAPHSRLHRRAAPHTFAARAQAGLE